MTILETTKTNLESSHETAPTGRFFNLEVEPNPQTATQFSTLFWAAHEGIMPEGYGVVTQLGLSKEGEFVDIDKADQRPPYYYSLSFDGRRAERQDYVWQLSVASSNQTGGVVMQLHTSREGTHMKAAAFDRQYQFSKTELYIDNNETTRLLEEIKGLASHPITRDRLDYVYQRQAKAWTDFSKFDATGKVNEADPKLFGVFYDKRYKQLEEQSSRGLVALAPRQL